MDEKEMKILIFSLNGERYATDISDVERILGYITPTEMPDVPRFVEGVVDYEDKILPIINLSNKFNFASSNPVEDEDGKKIIVVKRKEKKFGIIVDLVYEVKDVGEDRFEKAPEITTTGVRKYIKGLIKLDGKIIILLNLGKILSEDEEDSIF